MTKLPPLLDIITIRGVFRPLLYIHSSRLETKCHPAACRSAYGAKAIFIVLVIKNVLDGAVYPERHPFAPNSKRIAASHVPSTAAVKSVNVRVKCGAAKARGKVTRRNQEIEIDPKSIKSLCRYKRNLMIGYRQRR